MEINITWNVCRICLQEEDNISDENGDKTTLQWRNIFTEANVADQIYDCSGILIKSNDSLPQKICRKCELVLKQAIYFRTIARKSDKYLQNILEKAKSTTSLFQLDKPQENTYDDIIEDPTEDIFSEEHLLDETEPPDFKNKCNTNEFSEEYIDYKKRKQSTSSISTNESKRQNYEIEKDNSKLKNNDNLLIRDIQTSNKSHLDFGEIFLTSEEEETELDAGTENDDKQTEDGVSFIKSTNKNINSRQSLENDTTTTSNNYFCYKTLEVALSDDGEVEQDEMIAANNLDTDDIVKTSDNNELFYIFSDDVISKSENDASNCSKDTEMLAAIDEDEENHSENIDEDNIEEYIGSESNTLEPIVPMEDEFVKSDDISEEATANNENDEYYDDDILDRAILQLKPEYIKQKDNDERKINIVKPSQSRQINFVCQICENQFTNRSLLKHHMRIHRNERTYECELCYKRFSAACNLTTHMRTHTGEKPFVCQFCQRRFSDKSTQVKHERTHTDERPYSCAICHKAFTLSSSLKAHSKVHTGEKPFSCEPCGKSFKLPHQLKAHLSTNAHQTRLEEEYIIPNN